MLRKTKVKLKLLTEYDMHLLIEKGFRDIMRQCTIRDSKANNTYVGKQFK